jgi:V/A-type H+-transporting ATPase subunit K
MTLGIGPSFALYTRPFCAARETSIMSDLTQTAGILAAGIAIAGGLIGTGVAQSGIGAAGMGIIAEKPEKFGQVLFFFVIPETLWIIGFVLGIILLKGIL